MSRIALDANQRDWLASHYPEMTNPEIVEACREMWGIELGDTQLRNFAQRHGLRKRQEVRNRAVRLARGGMSDAELEFVREYTPGHSWRELADRLEEAHNREVAEKEKLREYVSVVANDVYKGDMFNCMECRFFEQCYNCGEKEHKGNGCQWWLWARELGIEV